MMSNSRSTRCAVCGAVVFGMLSAHVHVTIDRSISGLALAASLPPSEDHQHTHSEQELEAPAATIQTVATSSATVAAPPGFLRIFRGSGRP